MLNLTKKGNSIRCYHREVANDVVYTSLSADADNAQDKATVFDVYGIEEGSHVLIGDFGQASELKDVDSLSDLELTLSANLTYDHGSSTRLTVLLYDAIELAVVPREIYTEGEITSLEVKTIEVARDFTSITAEQATGFYIARFVDTASEESGGSYNVASEWSCPMPVRGNPANSVEKQVFDAIKLVQARLNDGYADEDDLISDANDCWKEICNLRNYLFEQKEIVVPTTKGGQSFDLTSYNLKHGVSKTSIESVTFNGRPVNYIDYGDIEDSLMGAHSLVVASTADITDTEIVFEDTTELGETGTLYVPNIGNVDYSANDKTTATLTVAALTVEVPAETVCWQGAVTGTPTLYALYNGKLLLNTVLDETVGGISLKLKVLKNLDELTCFQSVIDVQFHEVFKIFIASRIETRRGNSSFAKERMTDFVNSMSTRISNAPKPAARTYNISTRPSMRERGL